MLPSTLIELSSELGGLPDSDLLAAAERCAGNEREATVRLVASLLEIDKRRLYRDVGCSSLFTYCTEVLRLSEHAAYLRMEAARTARKFPVVLERLASGDLTLTAVGLLAKHLTPENHVSVIDAARRRSKRDLEHLVAAIAAEPDVASRLRRLPPPRLASEAHVTAIAAELAGNPSKIIGAVVSAAREALPPDLDNPALDLDSPPAQALAVAGPAPNTVLPPVAPAVVRAIAPGRYKLQVTISADTDAKLRRVRDLLRHVVPDGDLAAVIDRALTVLLADLEKKQLAATDRPCVARESSPGTRHIPASVKRAVWARDQGRCAFEGSAGRCTERGFLEFHHRLPFAMGGQATVTNVELRCKTHNAFEAERCFGLRAASDAKAGSVLRQEALIRDDSTRSGPS